MNPEKDPVEDPTVNTGFYSPTDKEKSKPDLFNYFHVFDHPPFLNNVEVPLLDKYGRQTKDKNTGKKNQDNWNNRRNADSEVFGQARP